MPRRLHPALCLLGMLFAVTAPAAPLGTVRLQNEGQSMQLALRTEGASVRARRNERDGDAWALVVMADGPRLVNGAGASAAMAACDATLRVTLVLDDADADGRIEAKRGERARLLVSAGWRGGGVWHSAVLVVDIGAAGVAALSWQQDSRTLPALGRLLAAPTLLHEGPAREEAVIVASGWPRESMEAARSATGELLQFDARTGRVLSSVFAIDASLISGVTAVDLDGDGITDRLYVADARWRVWRLDRAATTRRAASPRFEATLFADLGAAAEPGAALQFAPDVALIGSGTERHLDISLGSSNAPGREALRHWLFVLRDSLSADSGSTVPFTPIRPADLLRLDAADVASTVSATRGGMALLSGPLTAAVLTVAGHHLIATRTTGTHEGCELHVIESQTLQVTILSPTLELRSSLVTAERDARLNLTQSSSGSAEERALLECRLGSTLLTQCPRISAVRRDYWLRKDAS